jgi:hypothetical protein
MAKMSEAKSNMERRKNISLAPTIRRMGEKLADKEGMTFSGYLAHLIRTAKDRTRPPPMQMYGVADQANRFEAVNHAIDQLRKRLKSGEEYSNSLFDQLRRAGVAVGKLDHRVAMLEEAGKKSDSLGQSGCIEQKPVPTTATPHHIEGES